MPDYYLRDYHGAWEDDALDEEWLEIHRKADNQTFWQGDDAHVVIEEKTMVVHLTNDHSYHYERDRLPEIRTMSISPKGNVRFAKGMHAQKRHFCPQGHITKRLVLSGFCRDCDKHYDTLLEWKEEDPELLPQYSLDQTARWLEKQQNLTIKV